MRRTEPKATAARMGAEVAGRKRAELLGLLGPCFTRAEAWLQAGKYVAALVSGLPGPVSGPPVHLDRSAHRAGHGSPSYLRGYRRPARGPHQCSGAAAYSPRPGTALRTGMISLTVRENGRLLAAALFKPHPPGHAEHWLTWRRDTRHVHAGTTNAYDSRKRHDHLGQPAIGSCLPGVTRRRRQGRIRR